MKIRPETRADYADVRRVNERAFGRAAEADLVDALRRVANPHLSLVAEEDRAIIGHIFFSPVKIPSAVDSIAAMALAPMAVMPERQRQGVGSALVRAGLEANREMRVGIVVVLGHIEYYPRFGFVRADEFALRSEFDVPSEYFMVMELRSGALRDARGVVAYHEAFRDVS